MHPGSVVYGCMLNAKACDGSPNITYEVLKGLTCGTSVINVLDKLLTLGRSYVPLSFFLVGIRIVFSYLMICRCICTA